MNSVVEEIKMKSNNNIMFFMREDEANSFAKSINDAIKKYGFEGSCSIKKNTMANGKKLFAVVGNLYNNHAPASFKVVPVESEKVTVDFHSKKEAEEEIKNFNKDLKDATYLFEVGVSLLG